MDKLSAIIALECVNDKINALRKANPDFRMTDEYPQLIRTAAVLRRYI